jgi:hypothetical protein
MDSNSLLRNRFKAQVNKFSGNLTKGLKKNHRRLVKEMIYGIQASKDVKLSNISRSLQEPIPLIKTENRLSRNLENIDLTSTINGQMLLWGKNKVTDEMVLSIDPGDIMKPYSKNMEYLCNVYDGDKHKKAKGYHLCQVTAANLSHDKLVPLYCEAYSNKVTGYEGATEKIKQIISHVSNHTGKHGTWAIDRQGDNLEIIKHFEAKELNFVTRLTRKRYLHFRGNTARQVKITRIERFVNFSHKTTVMMLKNNKVKHYTLQYGALKVSIPEYPYKWYWLIVVKGFGKTPMFLLTNRDIPTNAGKHLWKIIEIYLTRWKCEEFFRYMKQSYNLEDIRVRSYNAIRNIVAIVHSIAYFCSIYLGMNVKLKLMVHKMYIFAKRFFGVRAFYQYAMADGIAELLKGAKRGIIFKGKTGKTSNCIQLKLFPI